MRILAIAGSLRRGSYNRSLLEAARRRVAHDDAGEVEGPGVEHGSTVAVEILDPEAIRALPHFDEDLEADPGAPVERLRAGIAAADAILIATPEYNHSIPGALKNAIDWASRPKREAALLNKPAAVIGTSTGSFGAVWAQAEIRKALGGAGARVLEHEFAVARARDAFDERGELREPALAEALDGVVAALAAQVREREGELAAA